MDAHYIGNLPGLAAPEQAHYPVVDLASRRAAVAPPAGVTPTSDNAPWQARVEGNEKTNAHDFASDDAHGKAPSTMTAGAKQCKCTLRDLAVGSFLVARWNYSRAVPCLPAMRDMLRQIGGRS